MITTITQIPTLATPEAIAPFGTLIEPADDGVPFGPADATLALTAGTPRFYIMRLYARPNRITAITRHRAVTQCLASVGARDWFIGLAAAVDPDNQDEVPDPTAITVFRIPGGTALAMNRGTWHAGPYFDGDGVDFLNLELSDTNIADHHTVRLDDRFGLAIEFSIGA